MSVPGYKHILDNFAFNITSNMPVRKLWKLSRNFCFILTIKRTKSLEVTVSRDSTTSSKARPASLMHEAFYRVQGESIVTD